MNAKNLVCCSKTLLLSVSLALATGADSIPWKIAVGQAGSGQQRVIRSSGDIYREVKGAQPEITGYVPREELDILSRLLADPQLQQTAPSQPQPSEPFLTFTYGDLKKTFALQHSSASVERLSREVERALAAAKQGD